MSDSNVVELKKQRMEILTRMGMDAGPLVSAIDAVLDELAAAASGLKDWEDCMRELGEAKGRESEARAIIDYVVRNHLDADIERAWLDRARKWLKEGE